MRKYAYAVILSAVISALVMGPVPLYSATSGVQIEFLLSQVRNATGSLAGGKVYFYSVGTTTPKDVYLDINKTPPVAANPYTLDANGTALLYGDGTYRVVIKTSAGVTVYDRDNLKFEDLATDLINSEYTIALKPKSLTGNNTGNISGYDNITGSGSGRIKDYLFGSASYTDNGYFQDIRTKGPIIDVRAYGAVGDGVTSDFVAIRTALRAAIASTAYGQKEVYIPAGEYKIDQDGLFSDLGAAGKVGIKIKGAGWFSTRLILSPTASDLWFYNNTTNPTMQFAVFQDIGFFGPSTTAPVNTYAGISSFAKGFKIQADTGTGSHDQGFKFVNCYFGSLDTAFQFEGTNTASEMLFLGCKFSHIKSAVYVLNNIQTFNHTFIGTDIEVIYGDIFQIKTLGGGSIKAYGGSWIMMSDSGTDHYVINMPDGTAGIGGNACPFTINGVRFELQGDHTKFLYAPLLAGGSFMVTVNDSTFWESGQTSTKTDWVTIGPYKSVAFNRCSFLWENLAYYDLFHLTDMVGYGQSGRIDFIDSIVPIDFSTAITIDGYGKVSARGCYGVVGAVVGEPQRFAQDFDIGGMKSSARDTNVNLKTAVIKASNWGFPTDNTTGEATLKLPANSIIQGFYISRVGSGADSTSYRLYVGNNDQTTSYADSGAGGTAADNSIISIDNVYVDVGTTDNERTVRIWAVTGGTVGAYTGIALVRYY